MYPPRKRHACFMLQRFSLHKDSKKVKITGMRFLKANHDMQMQSDY